MTTKANETPRFADLTGPQTCVLLALLSGATVTDSARKAGVDRSTVSGWVNVEGPFRQTLAQLRAEVVEAQRDRILGLTDKALHALETVLESPLHTPGAAVRAALEILRLAGVKPSEPDSGSLLEDSDIPGLG